MRTRAAASLLVAAIALLLYATTLLPGQDLGDTASFQTIVSRQVLVPRQAYPLYYWIGGWFVRLIPGEPARALNLASAVAGALAAGLLAWVTATIARSRTAGIAAGLLLATSYTFWSQSIIAEVYALHLLVIGACLAALLAWSARASTRRLAAFLAVCAAGFGNHLSMVLLLPGFFLFLILHAPQGIRRLLRPRVILMALALAALGAMQYLPSFMYLWRIPERAPGIMEPLRTFWFDITKADWRASMVLGIRTTGAGNRLAMYWFDLNQQFGTPAIAAAVGGTVFLLATRARLAASLLLVFAVNWLFAFTYNVGDAHVFYLPSHLVVALFAGCGVGALQSALGAGRTARLVGCLISCAALAYPAWRAFDTWPAMDRSRDRRATELFDRLTTGLDGRTSVLVTDLNWQLENGLDYYVQHTRPFLARGVVSESLLHFPYLVRDNSEIRRDVVLTAAAADMVRSVYGDMFDIEVDPRLPLITLSEQVAALPAGTAYVLCRLTPDPGMKVDESDVRRAAQRLSGGTDILSSDHAYAVMAGRVGSRPVLQRSSDRPYRTRAQLGELRVDVRMEAWLPIDTIRRAGFGHVTANHRHALTIERGISFVAFTPDGHIATTAYAAALFAPQARYRIRADRAGAAGRF